MLKRKDLKFRLAARHKAFAVIQFAQFMKPTDVVTAVMEQFKTELAADIEKHGEGEIRRYLSHNFWTLNPKNGKMPEKFKELFETHKQLYLKTYTDSYLRHPRNVVRELDTLYEKCTEQLENADPDKARQLVPTMLKIIQTIRNTIDTIPFDQLENEEEELEKAQVAMVLNSEMAIPDPLEEEDVQKLKELLDTDAPFEKIRNFIEYLRCKNHDIFSVIPVRDNEKGKQLFLRGRRIELIGFGHPEPEERQPNTAVVGSITEHID
ncbi:hypothetical protein C6503_16190 [Candidatus Poribacteria bacterium]|nr:MAG: hypothetical protein C6503_16190 [Candidatus Poribacteria bacterium]